VRCRIPGSTPEEVERNLVRPVEEALATMPGIESMNSRANAEGGSVQVRFSDWTATSPSPHPRRASASTRSATSCRTISAAISSIAGAPPTARRSACRLTSQVDLTTRADLIERSIKQRLERLPGVARVEVEGVAKQEVLVALDKDRLTAHGVALNELVQQLQTANFSVSAGQITEAGQRLRVQPKGELLELQQLRDLRIDRRGTRLSDVADV
jgi:HAE1 family hydrophobic/amphiphilic exporter-1